MPCNKSSSIFATIPTGDSLSAPIYFADFEKMLVHIPSAWTAADIGFQVCGTVDGTYHDLYDDAGALVEITSVAIDQAFTVPVEVEGAIFVKLLSQTAGTPVVQAAARILALELKDL